MATHSALAGMTYGMGAEIPMDFGTDEVSRDIAEEIRGAARGASTQAGHRLIGSVAVRLVRAGRWPVTVVP